jgi:hypothetical protein
MRIFFILSVLVLCLFVFYSYQSSPLEGGNTDEATLSMSVKEDSEAFTYYTKKEFRNCRILGTWVITNFPPTPVWDPEPLPD